MKNVFKLSAIAIAIIVSSSALQAAPMPPLMQPDLATNVQQLIPVLQKTPELVPHKAPVVQQVPVRPNAPMAQKTAEFIPYKEVVAQQQVPSRPKAPTEQKVPELVPHKAPIAQQFPVRPNAPMAQKTPEFIPYKEVVAQQQVPSRPKATVVQKTPHKAPVAQQVPHKAPLEQTTVTQKVPTLVVHKTSVVVPHKPALSENNLKKNATHLVISEISASPRKMSRRWFEIYNGTPGAVDLGGYAIDVRANELGSPDNSLDKKRFYLPKNISIASGHYIIIQAAEYGLYETFKGSGNGQSNAKNTDQLITLSQDGYTPFWNNDNGSIELIKKFNNQTIDVVKFGSVTLMPKVASQWKGSSAVEIEKKSLVRDINNTDTNTAQDWKGSLFPTPDGVNDLTNCELDEDGDGIPDCAEVEGATYAGMPLYKWGARQDQKDIFIEIDHMRSLDKGITPQREALEKVKAAFAKHDYVIHFDTGSLYHSEAGISQDDFDLGGGNEVPFAKSIAFKTTRQVQTSFYDYKAKHMDLRRRQVFFYMLFANSQEASGLRGSSGIAELNGNDTIITLGDWNLTRQTEATTNVLINFQASTIMHEFGHNLGLDHGGDNSINNKPNYYSIMNYLYQLPGLSTIGNREGDRFYMHAFPKNKSCANQALINGPQDDYHNFKIDYSNGTGKSIDEAHLNEAQGIGRDITSGIDFNCNGTLTDNSVDLKIIELQKWDKIAYAWVKNNHRIIMHDYDDWGNIDINFQKYKAGSSDVPFYDANNEIDTPQEDDFLLKDKQETVIETNHRLNM